MHHRLTALAAVALAAAVWTAPAAAQSVPSITVTPLDSQTFGGGGYTGPYRNLPGVAMFRGRIGPGLQASQVKLPQYTIVPQEYRLQFNRRPRPTMDGWHGSIGDGIPF